MTHDANNGGGGGGQTYDPGHPLVTAVGDINKRLDTLTSEMGRLTKEIVGGDPDHPRLPLLHRVEQVEKGQAQIIKDQAQLIREVDKTIATLEKRVAVLEERDRLSIMKTARWVGGMIAAVAIVAALANFGLSKDGCTAQGSPAAPEVGGPRDVGE